VVLCTGIFYIRLLVRSYDCKHLIGHVPNFEYSSSLQKVPTNMKL
jgi:hypothetical protein